MLKKSYRLKKVEVERLYKKGKVISQDFILARFASNRTDHGRFAVIISKKTLPQASDRNRLRRIIYDWVYSHRDQWEGTNFDLSLSIKKQLDEAKIGEVLAKLFEQLK